MPPTDSPYRPPAAALAEPDAPIRYEATGTFSIARCVKDAWASVLQSFAPLFCSLVLFLGVFWVLGDLIDSLAVDAPPYLGSFGADLAALCVLYLGVAPLVTWGTTRLSLTAIDGRGRIGDLFDVFSGFDSRVGKLLTLWLITVALQIPGELPRLLIPRQDPADLTQADLWSMGWSLVTFPVYFSFYFLVDAEMRPIDTLRGSWDLFRRNWIRMIGLLIVSAGIALAGIFALLIGIIPALMIVLQLYPSAFRQMVGRLEPATAARGA
jgi:hypothetical protein